MSVRNRLLAGVESQARRRRPTRYATPPSITRAVPALTKTATLVPVTGRPPAVPVLLGVGLALGLPLVLALGPPVVGTGTAPTSSPFSTPSPLRTHIS